MTRWIALLLLLCASAAGSCPLPDCIRVGSWNIEWLGSSKREQPTNQQSAEMMAALIADELSIDIIALQEINTSLSGKQRGDFYSLAPWQHLQAALARRGYQVATGNSGNAQRVVLAWRQPVHALTTPTDMEVDDHYSINDYCRSSGLRKPLLGRFRAGHFDFWLAGFHLKASTGSPAACTTAIRKAQLKQVVEKVPSLRGTEKDMLFIGDFNAAYKHESLSQLRDHGFINLNDQRTERSVRTPSAKPRNKQYRVDHIMVMTPENSESIEKSAGTYAPADAEHFRATLSDHLPVWADFSTLRDDD